MHTRLFIANDDGPEHSSVSPPVSPELGDLMLELFERTLDSMPVGKAPRL